MGELRRLLRAAAPRCPTSWSEDVRGVTHWHTCVLVPGSHGPHPHTCLCGDTLAQAGAA